QMLVFQFFSRVVKSANALAYALLAPALIAIIIFFIYPFVFNVLLSFSDLRLVTFSCYSPTSIRPCNLNHLYGVDYAIKNYTRVFVQTDSNGNVTWGPLLRTTDSTFPVLFGRTVLWTVLNVVFHIGIGLGLALLLNRKIKFKGIYRAL